jgi:chromosome segregation ATPase
LVSNYVTGYQQEFAKMINALSPMIPPPLPTAEALTSAMTLLQVAADPAGTRARLDELTEQVKVVHSAIAEHDAAAKKADESRAALATVLEREKAVNEREQAVAQAQTQAAVASAALANREQAANERDADLEKRSQAVAVKEKDLADRIAGYRRALG